MSDEMTCGKGLAARSTLPATLAAVTAAMADVLEGHRKSLDTSDAAAHREDDAYATVVSDFRGITGALESVAARMLGYRDLPMAPHDMQVLAGAEATRTFESYVRAERELLQLLERTIEQDEAMLSAMRA